MAKKKRTRALVLFSGGLDSMLAAKVLTEAGIEVTGICFKSNFFDCQRARQSARTLGMPLLEKDISAEILGIVKSPECGYGKNLNPCIDCHAFMIREAAKYLKPLGMSSELARALSVKSIKKAPAGKEIFDFIATGEVLGQRPFSQNRQALERVRQLAGVDVLRPLSAALLPETAAEKSGLVKREKLLDIEGRSREKQMKLAEKFGIKKYPSPAGGCLLTDPEGSKRILDIMLHCPDCKPADVELLKYGRVFWLKIKNGYPVGSRKTKGEILKCTLSLKDSLKHLADKNFKEVKVEADINFQWVLAVIGRDQSESEKLEKLAKKGDIVVKLGKITGPTALVRLDQSTLAPRNTKMEISIPKNLNLDSLETEKIKNEKEIFGAVGLLTGYYAPKARGKIAVISFKIK